jgi:hypothetical protein
VMTVDQLESAEVQGLERPNAMHYADADFIGSKFSGIWAGCSGKTEPVCALLQLSTADSYREQRSSLAHGLRPTHSGCSLWMVIPARDPVEGPGRGPAGSVLGPRDTVVARLAPGRPLENR